MPISREMTKEQLYREMLDQRLEGALLPGLRAFLAGFQDIPMAVASNAEPANVNFVLDRAGLRTYFDAVVDGHQVANPKPYPDIYLRAAELLAVKVPNCLVFEDSPSGVAAAAAAGMGVIGLRTTYVNLPGTCLTIDNFLCGELTEWLRARMRPV